MLIYAGIDEAGYGPMLGPLCVGATVFVVPNYDPVDGAPDLWAALDKGVCRAKSDRRHRIAVDDSKNLKLANNGKKHPLTHLERGVLSFLANREGRSEDGFELPQSDDALLAALSVRPLEAAWYDTVTPLPLAHAGDELRIAANRLNRALSETGILCPLLSCEAIDAGDFNEQIARTKSKASVNLAAALRLVQRIWNQWPDHHPRIVLDRHGGRLHYREELQLAWPDAHIRIIAEEDGISRYRLARGDSLVTISFIREAERGHLPVALASMTAKLTRELLMLRLNRFFQRHLPELKPTAGYVQDARRYLRDIASVIKDLKLPTERLIRQA